MMQQMTQRIQTQVKDAPLAARAQRAVRSSEHVQPELQRGVSNHFMLGRGTGTIQPKLVVGAPNDQYEQEADRVAEAVMRQPEEEEEAVQTKPLAAEITPLVQRQEEESEEEEEEPLQANATSGQVPHVTPEVGARIESLRGGGEPLPEPARAFFEPRFGYDFGQVRVHADAQAAATARMLSARAFTMGRHVAFAAGNYAPETTQGQRLLAHELTHVVQQAAKRQPDHVRRVPAAAPRKVTAIVTKIWDGFASVAPYSHGRCLNVAYKVPTYRMDVSGSSSSGVRHFRVIRFGFRRRDREPSPPPATRSCDTGLPDGRTSKPYWITYYRPFSFTGMGRPGAWALVGKNILLHEGPPETGYAGTLGCIEVVGMGEWDRFLDTVKTLAGASWAKVGNRRALTVQIEPAPRPGDRPFDRWL